MKDFDFNKAARQINSFTKDRDWEKFHTLKNLSMALTVEASELQELFQWLTDEEIKDFLKDSSKKEKLEDEVSDVLSYLVRIVTVADIDLEKAFENKLKKNNEKYPVEKAFGKMTKYNQLK